MSIKITKSYETIFIIVPVLDDDKIESMIDKYSALITKSEGSVIKVDKLGRKKLAYPIKKKHSGFYVSIEFTSTTDFLPKLERAYNLDDNVIRYLTISFDRKTIADRNAHLERKMTGEGKDKDISVSEQSKEAEVETVEEQEK